MSELSIPVLAVNADFDGVPGDWGTAGIGFTPGHPGEGDASIRVGRIGVSILVRVGHRAVGVRGFDAEEHFDGGR